MDLEEYISISVNQVKTVLTEGKIISNERLNKNNQEFQKLEYTFVMNDIRLKLMQYCWVIDNKAYALTLMSEAGTTDRYEDIGEQILDSFTLNK